MVDRRFRAVCIHFIFYTILVLPTFEAYNQRKLKEEAAKEICTKNGNEENVIWFKQTINNTCDFYTIFHAVCNIYIKGFLRKSNYLSFIR